MKKRWPYMIITVILLISEVLIGAFVHDNFIRPYFGDVLVTLLLCSLVRCVIPDKIKHLWLWVFLFSLAVESVQLLGLADRLGITNHIIRTMIGSHFSWADIACYLVGCLVFLGGEWLFSKVSKRNHKRHA